MTLRLALLLGLLCGVARAGDPRAQAAAVTSETIVDEQGREYARTALLELAVPDQERVLPGRTFVAVTWTHHVPPRPGGNVFVRYLRRAVVQVDAAGARQLPDGAFQATLEEALLSAGPVASDAAARLELGRSWMYLLQLGDEPRGQWWGADATHERVLEGGGHALLLRWQHGKSFSSTDHFTLRFDPAGRLVGIDHEEDSH